MKNSVLVCRSSQASPSAQASYAQTDGLLAENTARPKLAPLSVASRFLGVHLALPVILHQILTHVNIISISNLTMTNLEGIHTATEFWQARSGNAASMCGPCAMAHVSEPGG